MAQWQMTLDFKDFWNMNDGHASKELVSKVVEEITKNIPKAKIIDKDLAFDLEYEILTQFEDLADQENVTDENFNYVLEELYDWADTSLDNEFGGKKMCWVKTI